MRRVFARQVSMRQAPRHGLSLLEVILAIAILGGSLATIGQLIRIGARNAAEERDRIDARCRRLGRHHHHRIGTKLGRVPHEGFGRANIRRRSTHDQRHTVMRNGGNDIDKMQTLIHRERVIFAGDAGVYDGIRTCSDGEFDHARERGRIGRAVSAERCHEYRTDAVDR